MAKYALITSGIGVDEFRDVDPADVPKHKLAPDGGPMLRPVVENDVPAFRQQLAQLNTQISVGKDFVTITHTADPFPLWMQRGAIKLEARRRILERFPDWKQTNMTARSVELQDIWRLVGKWTEQEQAEADGMKAAWAWIKAIREASNAIEALEAVPVDFDSDERWPS